jgi:hypothetical protein
MKGWINDPEIDRKFIFLEQNMGILLSDMLGSTLNFSIKIR